MDRAEKAVEADEGPRAGGDEAERRAVLAELSLLDDLTPDDEEEIGRFRSFAAPPTSARGGSGFGRMVGHLKPVHRRVAS